MKHRVFGFLQKSAIVISSTLAVVACSSEAEEPQTESGTRGDGDGDAAVSGSGGSTSTGGTTGDGDGAGDVTDTGEGRGPMGPPPVLTLTSECEGQGTSASFTVGDYDSAALSAAGLTPGAISTLQVTPGYKIILYTNEGFLGETITLTSSDTCLSGFSIAAMRVRENLGGEATAGTGGGATTDPGPPPCTSATSLEETCEPFGVLLAGRYWVNNNLWGQDAGSGSQCVRRTCTDGDAISWETNWSWSNNPSSVKSYASAVLGWHWGYHVQETGLPVQASENRSINCAFDYTVSQNGTMNVAYDLWFHSVADPQWGREGVPTDQPTDELMIWTYHAGGAGPIGQVQATVSIGGASWALHRGAITENGQTLWNVYSFVRSGNTSSSNLDINDFVSEVVSRGWMPSSRYLTSIQAGPEVFVGEGTLTTNSFSCAVQ